MRRSSLLLGLLVAIATLLAACGSAPAAPATPQADTGHATAAPASDDDPFVAEAKRLAAEASAPVTNWDGPTSGPKAQAGKFVISVGSDLNNGGVLGVTEGAEEAAKVIGWKFQALNGKGTLDEQIAALEQALKLKPDAIIVGIDLRRSPLFTTVAILSLALGIGANTAIFTLIDQILLRKLPVRAPEELVMLYQRGPHNGSNMGPRMHSYPIYQDYQQKAAPLSEVMCRRLAAGVGQHRQPDRTRSTPSWSRATTSRCWAWPRPPAACSTRREDDQVFMGHPVVVLSYDYWAEPLRARPGRRRQEDPRQQLPDDDRRRLGGRLLRRRPGDLAGDPRPDPDEGGDAARVDVGPRARSPHALGAGVRAG